VRGTRFRVWLIIAAAVVPLALGLVAFIARAPRGPEQRAPVRHTDPAAVPVEADPAAAFEWYLATLSRFANWRFQEGRRLLLHLDRANLPPEIRGLVGDLNALVIKEGSILEAADAWLRKASDLIAAGRVEEARPLLEQLTAYARRAEAIFGDVGEGFRDLATRSNVEALPADAPQRRAYEQLQRVAARAGALLLAYGAVAKDHRSVAAVAGLLPYETTVSLAMPSTVYPGRPFEVSGRVNERAPVPSSGRLITLRLDDWVLAELPLGPFRRELVLPEGTLPGTRRLTVSVPTQGRYLGATAHRSLLVTRATPVLRLQPVGSVVVPGRLAVSGLAKSDFGPVAGATVQLRIGRITGTAQTSAGGEFHAVLDLSAAPGLVGPQTLAVRLVSREPWNGPVEAGLDVFVINLVSAGLAAVVLLPVGGAIYVSTRRRGGPVRGEALAAREVPARQEVPARRPVPAPAAPEQVSVSAPLEPAVAAAPATPRDELLALYRESLRLVEAATGSRMEPSATLREFARRVRPRLISEAFAEMTGLAEVAFYSPRIIVVDLVERARRLKVQLERETAGAAS
jgi:hypothetical protein